MLKVEGLPKAVADGARSASSDAVPGRTIGLPEEIKGDRHIVSGSMSFVVFMMTSRSFASHAIHVQLTPLNQSSGVGGKFQYRAGGFVAENGEKGEFK